MCVDLAQKYCLLKLDSEKDFRKWLELVIKPDGEHLHNIKACNMVIKKALCNSSCMGGNCGYLVCRSILILELCCYVTNDPSLFPDHD